MLAAVLTLLGFVFVILGAVITMTGTALRISENFRSAAEVDRATDAAMEEVLNFLRRNDDNDTCAGADTSESPAFYDDGTFNDSDPENVVPLEEFLLPTGRSVLVKVTCRISVDPRNPLVRRGVVEAFVDGSTSRTGRASFEIFDQTRNSDLSRLRVTEWQIGTVTDTPVPEPALEVEYLIVAGGGAGGEQTGGGGGGGGVVTNLNSVPLDITNAQFSVVVGAGGVLGNGRGGDGEDSSFNGIVARGGGAGGTNNTPGRPGGSGGGGGHDRPGGLGTERQGNAGGTGTDLAVAFGGGGGGGAGAVGFPGTDLKGGNGGGGVSSNISGSSVVYGGGGGGGLFNRPLPAPGVVPAPGGAGGGGNGGYGPLSNPVLSTNGAPNTGGGGGGQGNNQPSSGSGGSGIVIIRYPGSPKAQGGTITQVGGFTVHTFTATGPATFTVLPQLEYLVVGGGGAGGGRTGGGGGAGGVLTNENDPTGFPIGAYTVVVGAGGLGSQSCASPTQCPGANGGNSRFGSLVSTGGGGGGDNGDPGLPGGSGGGGGHDGAGGAGTAPQGNNGGAGMDTINIGQGVFGGGGGGGASAVGQGAVIAKGGDGGAGISSSMSGTAVTYGGGGGGGAFVLTAVPAPVAPGGAGGGGNGGHGLPLVPVPPTDGAPNTGGGGGGQRQNVNTTGGAGGSGIVVIRYTGAPRATGGTITRAGDFTYHTFATPGTYTITFS